VISALHSCERLNFFRVRGKFKLVVVGPPQQFAKLIFQWLFNIYVLSFVIYISIFLYTRSTTFSWFSSVELDVGMPFRPISHAAALRVERRGCCRVAFPVCALAAFPASN
jgi:hypothetical protein